MQNAGTPLSTGEGWSVLVLLILQGLQHSGWIPADMDTAVLQASVTSLVVAVVFAGRKLARKGSIPFLQDGHTISIQPTTKETPSA